MPAPTQDTTTIADSLYSDSLAEDSAATTETALLISDPSHFRDSRHRPEESFLQSWLMTGILLLFCIICFKFRKNVKFIRVLIRDLVSTRERGNMFDDTVREKTFLALLNAVCAFCMGLLLVYAPDPGNITAIPSNTAAHIAVCMGLSAIYCLIQPLAYLLVGSIFSNLSTALLWTRGFLACQSLLAIMLLLPSTMLLFYTSWTLQILCVCVILIIAARIIFIWRGLRIFFTQNSSLLIFLCYLCSMEIAPLLIMYASSFELYSLI